MMDPVRVAALDDLPEGRGVRVEAGGRAIALFRVGDQVFALADRCSHAQASLAEGDVFGYSVECPRHGAEFDLRSGEAASLPATRPVAVYRVEAAAGNVYVYPGPGEEEPG